MNERSLAWKGSDSDAGQIASRCAFQGHQFKVYMPHLRENTSHHGVLQIKSKNGDIRMYAAPGIRMNNETEMPLVL